MTDREKHLDWLYRLKSDLKVFIPKDFHLDEFEQSLDYAISSINTDLKYDLIYEGEEVYTKADMVAMLEDLDLQIDESAAYNLEVAKVQRLIRDRIDALKVRRND